jgi:ethanolamine utilization protein EutQ (cupin superfamily)
VAVNLNSQGQRDASMTQVNLERIRTLRQQIIAETSHGFADWNLVQQLLDDLMLNHQQYKQFAIKENIGLYQ